MVAVSEHGVFDSTECVAQSTKHDAVGTAFFFVAYTFFRVFPWSDFWTSWTESLSAEMEQIAGLWKVAVSAEG